MTEDITSLEKSIADLRVQSRARMMPRRSINYQFQYMRTGNRNIARDVALIKKERLKLNKRIIESKTRLDLLKSSLLLEK